MARQRSCQGVWLVLYFLTFILCTLPAMSAEAAMCRLDELVIEVGMAEIEYTGTDSGKKGTGLRLVSHGKIRDDQGQDIYSVWRVRNASDDDKEVTVDGYKSSFRITFTAAAHTETFFRSDFAEGSATHRLFYNSVQIDVKASSQTNYSDGRLVPCEETSDTTPPVITISVPADGSSITNAPLLITIDFSDDTGIDTATFSVAINGVDATGQFSITATQATYQPAEPFAKGANSITASVSDTSGNSVEAVSHFTVINTAPTAASQQYTLFEDETVPITLGGTDIDGEPLTFRIGIGPSQGFLSGTAPELTYSPAVNYHGADSFTFVVNDGQADSPEATVTIAVSPVNDPPSAAAGVDQSVYRGDTVLLDGSGSMDVDGDNLTYLWSFLAVPAGSSTTLSDPGAIRPAFLADVAGTYEVQLIVSDGAVNSAADGVAVTAEIPMVSVPNVVGQTQTDAQSQISAAGLLVGSVTTAYSDTVPVDSVISQSPAAGASVEEGALVDFTVSLGMDPNAPPTVSLTAFPSTISWGDSATLTWTSQNGQNVYIDNGVGTVNMDGSVSVSPESTTTYTITVTGIGGSSSDQVTVVVTGVPFPQPEGSFGAAYEDLVPIDATVEAYEPKRFALITGLVNGAMGQPLENVTVTVIENPAYGSAATGFDGRFSLPVEGGGFFTVRYQKQGYISAERKVYVPWNDTAVVETTALIVADPVATAISFDGDPDTVVTHQSSMVSDAAGSRSATVIFTGDNQAYLTDQNGNDVHPLPTINVQATEYQTPESMPAKLPPNSAFTYCVELAVEGVDRVRFEKPVTVFVDNFLGFPVGGIVPVGYYDRDRSTWVPADNGTVVMLLDTDTDGIVDALDADGDGQADDLDTDGVFADEVQGLEDSQRYAPQATFWRVAVSHFTPFDFNWPYVAPPDAIAPNASAGVSADIASGGQDSCTTDVASFVEDRARTIHEDLPIPGTDMTLHYTSSRTAGYKPGVITIPASGDSVPDSLERIVVEVRIAGRLYTVNMPGLPNQIAEVKWDGLDHLGRPVAGPVFADIRIGFVYFGVYAVPAALAQSFGMYGTGTLYIPTRAETIMWKRTQTRLVRGIGTIAEGWTLSAHHWASPQNTSLLLKGDGTTLGNNIRIIEHFAGDGSGISTFGGMGGPATEAQIGRVGHIASDAEGNVYIVSMQAMGGWWKYRFLKIDGNGIITEESISPEQSTTNIEVAPDGTYYFSRDWYNCVRKASAGGSMETAAGTCSQSAAGFSGDGGPATEARLQVAGGVAVDKDGNLYIADVWNHRIRRVDTSGVITTVAGSGPVGSSAGSFSGDGGPATQARLSYPWDVAVDGEGNIYIADIGNQRIRKVDSSGIITTVAGDGTSVYAGDGVPAIETGFYHIEAVETDNAGNLHIVGQRAQRIWKVDGSGIITTVAGSGPMEYDAGINLGDGGPATAARLNEPKDVTFDAAGNLYLVDYGSRKIRKIGNTTALVEGAMYASDIVFAEEDGTAYVLSSSGRHLRTLNADTGVVLQEFSYDAEGRLLSVTDQFGRVTTIERDINGTVTAIVSPDGIRTALTVDGNQHLVRIAYSDGGYYDFDYTADGLLTVKTEPNGNGYEHRYDAEGRLSDVLDGEGGHWLFTRTVTQNGGILTEVTSGGGNTTTYLDQVDSTDAFASNITAPTGAVTVFSRSADGLVVNKSLACGMALDFTFDLDPEFKFKVVRELSEHTPGGLTRVTQLNKSYQDTDANDIPDLITQSVSVNGDVATFSNNTLQTQAISTSPEGRTVTVDYDPVSLLTERISVPGLYDTEYGYDAAGRLTSITFGERTMSYAYNALGFLESFTDGEQNSFWYTYDPVGRITSITSPDGNTVGFNYDANGNLTVLSNALMIDHDFSYNSVNRNSAYTTPSSGSYRYTYDKDRRLVRTDFPSGRQIFNIYQNGRLSQIQTPEGNVEVTYLCDTKVGTLSKDGEAIAYDYDGRFVTAEIFSGTLNLTLNYTYDNDFNLHSAAYAGGVTSYAYDNDGLLTGAGAYAITRNAANGLPEAVSGNGLSINRSFNAYGELDAQLTAISGTVVGDWSITRNHNGQIRARNQNVGGSTSNFLYTYDDAGRLLTVTKDGALVEEYDYNANGTRIYEMNALRGIAGRTYDYDAEDRLLTAGTASYTYDLDGFLTGKSDGTENTSYFYSSRGELLQVLLPDGRTVDYRHDPLGRRIAKFVDGVVEERYLWQGLTRLLAVYDGAGTIRMRFEYADGRMPVAMTAGGVTYFLVYDQIGSLIAVVDGVGNVVKSVEYDSFGNVITDSNPAFGVPFGFAGGLYDQDTGLIRFGYRDYDPDVGRWTAKDPISFGGGDFDLYRYAQNNPINFYDPLGLWGINYGGSLIGIDFSATLYDSNKGWFPSTTTDIGVSTTAFGGGIQITYDTGVESRSNPCEDVNVSMGMGKFLGVTYNTELSRASINLGLGLGLPITLGTPIQNFTQGLSNSLQRIFK